MPITIRASDFVLPLNRQFYKQTVLVGLMISFISILYSAFFAHYQYIFTTLGAYIQSTITSVQFELVSGDMSITQLIFSDPIVQHAILLIVVLLFLLSLSAFLPWIIFAPWITTQSRWFTLKHALIWYIIYVIYAVIIFVIDLKVSLIDKVISQNATGDTMLQLIDFALFIVYLFLFIHTHNAKRYLPIITVNRTLQYLLIFVGLFILNIILMLAYSLFSLLPFLGVIYAILTMLILVICISYVLELVKVWSAIEHKQTKHHTKSADETDVSNLEKYE
jgi:hypothetical protein